MGALQLPRAMRCLLAVLLVAAFLVAGPAAAQEGGPRSISVQGDALVQVAPDEVVLQIGVVSRAPALPEAKADNDARITAVLDAARRLGVPDGRLQTDVLSIEPRYRSSSAMQPDGLTGYEVQRSVMVTLREVEGFEALLSALLEAGANQVQGIDFRTTSLREHRDRARALALDAAREKAEAMAGRLGQRIGAPLSIAESGSWWPSRRGGALSQNVVVGGGPPPESTDSALSPGQIPVHASVRVTFELLPQ